MLLPLLLGQGSTGVTHYTLAVDPTSVSLTYSPVTLQAGRQVSVTATSYSYTHANPTLAVARQLSVTATNYSLSYSSATLNRGYATSVTATSYSLNYSSAALVIARQWTSDATSYSVTLSPATLLNDHVLPITGETLAITFANVSIDYVQSSKQILVDPFSVAVTPASVSLVADRQWSVTPATYGPVFTDATIELNRYIQIAPGSYDILASPCSLVATRVLNPSFDSITYVETGYVEPGYVGRSDSFSLKTRYVTDGYVTPGYVNGEVSAELIVSRVVAPTQASFALTFSDVAIGIVNYFPAPSDVKAGVIYGPDGMYVGTYECAGGATLAHWNGTQWINQQLKYWNGSTWV